MSDKLEQKIDVLNENVTNIRVDLAEVKVKVTEIEKRDERLNTIENLVQRNAERVNKITTQWDEKQKNDSKTLNHLRLYFGIPGVLIGIATIIGFFV